MSQQSWVIALEVDEDPDGPNLDVKEVARRMDAVGGIHPSADGGRRHSFLVRFDGRDPAEALVAAVARFREMPVAGAELLGARVIRTGRAEKVSARRSGIPRPRIVAAIACALLGVAALVALLPSGGNSNGARIASGISASSATAGDDNLLTNGSFEQASDRISRKGLARGVEAWGDARITLVGAPVKTGMRAQRVDVGVGRSGGLLLELPATAGPTYEQSAWVQVVSLQPGSRAEMIVEWYGNESNLLNYGALPLTATDTDLMRRAQTVKAPPGTTRARFLVNVTDGGSLVVDDAALRVSTPLPATAPDPAPR